MRSKEADALTGLILSIFRLNGQLLTVGNKLVNGIGLTAARWQTLGAAMLSDVPLNAPQIASIMGLTRQGVQKQLDALVDAGFMEPAPNPGHKRSPLYMVTLKGRKIYRSAETIQSKWANRLAAGIPSKRLDAANQILQSLSDRLDRC